ncbi:probable myosin light chain kinase DDB_G0275057 [Paramacrobiotus metropolitanus]|uniref:probable myosin light chain kinase DDB_G0275057 n=1 Tax=Paramacrobiotus metropolitanus TaxID=2943436 RepID=UPI002445945C|nr:probable myosin light chain kinase DDB_G0275057 [Paramacrobiotus metropolitanus]
MASGGSTKETELLFRLFNGVYGSIDKGVLTSTSEYIAVKHIRLDFHQPQRELQIQRLKANFDFTANLQHRNLVRQIHHQECEHDTDLVVNTAPERYEVITEFSKGENLHDFASTNDITAVQLQDIVGQIVCGVEYLHQQLYAHRDLRGANILIAIGALGALQVKLTGMGRISDALDRGDGKRQERGAWMFCRRSGSAANTPSISPWAGPAKWPCAAICGVWVVSCWRW